MRRLCSLSLCGGFVLACFLTVFAAAEDSLPKSGADVEPLLKPWRDAVEKYQAAEKKAKGVLTRLLDAAEEKARAAGDADELETLKQQRTLFEERGVLPSSVKTAAYERAMDKAKSTLQAVAKRVRANLVRQKMDDVIADLDEQLEELTGTGVTGQKKNDPAAAFPLDRRLFWKHQKEAANQFRMIHPGEWVESVEDGTRAYWKELARTRDYIELYDEKRHFGMRLKEGSADVDYLYKPGQTDGYGLWTRGTWYYDPDDVFYLADIKEKTFKVWDYLNDKQSGWSNNGEIEKKEIFIDNRPSVKGLFTYPPANDFASVKYDIAKLHRQIFRARVGVADWKKKDPETPLMFIVLGDGEKLFTSKPVTDWKDVQDCEVKIRGVKELELRVECPGPAGNAYAVWFEPRLSLK